MKDLFVSSSTALPMDPFAFNTLTFGLTFFDRKGKSSGDPDNREVGLGTNVPYYYNTIAIISVLYWEMYSSTISISISNFRCKRAPLLFAWMMIIGR